MNQAKLRRYQNLLILSGTGSIIFGFWTVIKVVLILATRKGFAARLLDTDNAYYELIFYILTAFLLIWILALRLYVGLCARSEGQGKKKHWFYLVVAILMFLTDANDLFSFNFDSTSYDSMYDAIVTMIVDLTSLITLGEMIVSSFIVKSLTKKAGKE